MAQMSDFALGLLFVVLGGVFWLIIRLIIKGAGKIRSARFFENPTSLGNENENQKDGVFIVLPGGRLESINASARRLFGIEEDDFPSLEHLAKVSRPNDLLLERCLKEGRSKIYINGQMVDVVSYHVTHTSPNVMMVTFRVIDQNDAIAALKKGTFSQSVSPLTELSQQMSSSLDLNKTLQAIMSNGLSLVAADLVEITIWDADKEILYPYRLVTSDDGNIQIESGTDFYTRDEGFTGVIATNRKPLLIKDVNERKDIRQISSRYVFPIQSFLGFPLLVGEEFLGTFEFGSITKNTFDEADQDYVSLVVGQAAVALHNALLFRAEKRRSEELASLAKLAQALSMVREPAGLFERMVDSIAPLFAVEIVGFLLFNENSRLLEAQIPFKGLPNQFVEIYRTSILPNSKAESTMLDQDVLISENAAEDPHWAALGLDHFAKAASMRESVLIPLSSSGHMLGYLQISNHLQGKRVFGKEELHLLTIIANQAAPVIENSTLVQQSRTRAQRAETLRRISSLAGSAVKFDEIIQVSMAELKELLHADIVALLLLDHEHHILELYPQSLTGKGRMPIYGLRITTDDVQFPFTVTCNKRTLVFHGNQDDDLLVPFYHEIFERWKIYSAVVSPLIIKDEGIGEIWFGSNDPNHFDQMDVQTIITTAGQLAGVVEQNVLSSQTDETLRNQVDQLTAMTRISQELSTSLDLKYLLQLVYDEALKTTGAECGTISLFDLDRPIEEIPSIRFFVGDKPGKDISFFEFEVVRGTHPVHIDNVLEHETIIKQHAGIASIILVPIYYRQRPVGLISLHSSRPYCFNDTSVEFTQSLAVQAAIAFGNAIQFDEQNQRSALLKRELEIQAKLFEVTQLLRPGQMLEDMLDRIGVAISEITPFTAVLISLYDPKIQGMRRVVGKGINPEAWQELQGHIQPWSGLKRLFKPEYRIGNIYFIPADKLALVPVEVHTVNILPISEVKKQDDWDPDDMLLIPLLDGNGNPLGLISVDVPEDGRRPDKPTLEALELFGIQASLSIQNALYVGQLQNKLKRLDAKVQTIANKTHELTMDTGGVDIQNNVQQLELDELKHQIERIHAGLETAEQATRQFDPQRMLFVTAQQIAEKFQCELGLIAEPRDGGIRLIGTVGKVPEEVNLEALIGQHNPLREILQNGDIMLVSNLDQNINWENSALLKACHTKSFIGIPLFSGDKPKAAILALSSAYKNTFTDEDRHMFKQVSNQVSVGIQNLSLLAETRRRLWEVNKLLEYSSNLGNLINPTHILQVLLQNILDVLVSVEAGWIGLWDAKSNQLVPTAAQNFMDADSLLSIRFSEQNGNLPLPVKVQRSGKSIRIEEINFVEDYRLPAEDLLLYKKASGGKLPVSSLLLPISVGEKILGVIVLDNYTVANAFNAEDENLVLSFAQQAVLGLENARLFQASEQRSAQLEALTNIAGTLTSSLRYENLIASLLDLLKSVIPYDTATLWIRKGELLGVAATSGFKDAEQRIGLTTSIEDSAIFQEMKRSGQAISVNDIHQDIRFASLVETTYHSWLGIPLILKSELTGIIALEKEEADFYTLELIQGATTFAGQAAVALDNATLYEDSIQRTIELDERTKRLSLLNQFSTVIAGSLELKQIIRLTSQYLIDAFSVNAVATVLVNEPDEILLQEIVPDFQLNLPYPIPYTDLFKRIFEYQSIYCTEKIESEMDLQPLVAILEDRLTVKSGIVVPLISNQNVLGWMVLLSGDKRRFSSQEIELSKTLTNQAAIAMQNARLLEATRQLTQDLEKRVEERTFELSREHRNSQTLLKIISELSGSLDLNQIISRTLNVINQSLEVDQSVIFFSREKRIFHSGKGLIDFSTGQITPGRRIAEQISQWVVSQQTAALVNDLLNDSRLKIKNNEKVDFQSILAVPLRLGAEIIGSLILLHHEKDYFLTEQIDLVEATAKQISISLNNAELYNLVREQAENLRDLLREQQIEASRSRAILEAVADGVLVTDEQNNITLFNNSAGNILNLSPDAVVNKSLDQLSVLIDKSVSDWTKLVNQWTQSPQSIKTGDTYAEQINLESGRYISVHLAPVRWEKEFLGTVSIFRDITSEVQVDRLKSEFIANVSHELRTPLTSIKGYAEIMLMGASGNVTDQQKHFLEIIQENTKRLSILVNDLLDISQIETGSESLAIQPLILEKIAQQVKNNILERSREENKPMQILIEADQDLPLVEGDQERISQVFSNLVINGYNYSFPNGEIRIVMRSNGKEVQTDIIDQGIGISPKDQEHIFERFFRGDDPMVLETAGTGLGLAVAKTLVEMHHGKIWLASSGTNGEGSVFSFTLPISQNKV